MCVRVCVCVCDCGVCVGRVAAIETRVTRGTRRGRCAQPDGLLNESITDITTNTENAENVDDETTSMCITIDSKERKDYLTGFSRSLSPIRTLSLSLFLSLTHRHTTNVNTRIPQCVMKIMCLQV